MLDRRLVFVTGKGGVGKSLVSAATARAAAEAGRRTLWVEMSETPKGGYLFPGYEPGYEPQAISDRLWGMNLRFQPALEEYLEIVFRFPFLGRRIANNQLFRVFTTALPGLDALVTTGKIWFEAERRRGDGPWWDRIIVDAPATGHGLAILKFPHAALDIVRSGPIADRARDIDAMLGDPENTALVAVATLEALPVDEARELIEGIRRDTGYDVAAVVANMVFPDLGSGDPARVRAWLEGGDDPALMAALGARASELQGHLRWLRRWRNQQRELESGLAAVGPTWALPWRPEIEEPELVRELASALASAPRVAS